MDRTPARPQAPGHQPIDYRPDIDGLRALAVFLVVAFHAGVPGMQAGFIGVDVFFVISGFLITGIIVRETNAGTFTITRFYARRARRILPALSLVLAACLVAGWFELDPAAYRQLGSNLVAGSTFVSNLWLWQSTSYFGGAGRENPLLHLWSLAVEEQYYAFWPLLLPFLLAKGRSFRVIALVLAASLVYSILLSLSRPTAAFYSPLSRAWELLMGSLLAVVPPPERSAPRFRETLSWVGIALIVAALLTVRKGDPFPGVRALLPTIGAACIILAGPAALANRAIFASAPAVGLGLISYPLYLWHWSALVFVRHRFGEHPTATAVIVVLSAAAAYATWRFVEVPIRRGTAFRFVLPLAGAQALAFAFGVQLVVSAGAPERFSADVRRLYAYAADPRLMGDTPGSPCLVQPQDEGRFVEACHRVRSPRVAAFRYLLWGDSYADHLSSGLQSLRRSDTEFSQLTTSLCPPILDYEETRRGQCRTMNAFVDSWIRQHRPDAIIIAARWNEYRFSALEATLAHLRRLGVPRVVVVGSTMQFPKAVPLLLAQQAQNGSIPERLSTPLRAGLEAIDDTLRAMSLRHGATFVSPMSAECDSHGCLVALSGSIDSVMVWDDGHLTLVGSRLVAERLLRPLLAP